MAGISSPNTGLAHPRWAGGWSMPTTPLPMLRSHRQPVWRATAISLSRVFPDWQYLRSMVAVIVGTHLVAALLRFLRVPLIVALPLMLFAVATC